MKLCSAFFFSFFFSAYVCFAQQSFSNKQRAEYIMSFAEHVNWQKINSDVFTIGVLAKDSLLFYMLAAEAEQKKTMHNKHISIVHFSSVNDIQPTQVLFFNNTAHFSIEDVRAKIPSAHTLLITENFPFNKSMINFIVADGKRNYEINERFLSQAQLSIHPLILNYAVKTEEDWEKLYEQTEIRLRKEEEKTKRQTKIIDIQIEDIKAKEREISELLLSIIEQQKILSTLEKEVASTEKELNKTLKEIAQSSEELEIQELRLEALQRNISQQQTVLHEQAHQIQEQNKTLRVQFQTIEQQHAVIITFIILLVLILALTYIIYRQFKKTKQYNIELAKQRDTIAEQNKHITDSIMYASRIQHAILPPQEIIANNVPEHFILFKPRDIVSGDYYWMTQIDDTIIVTAADCTGHGVPGAFMSLLGITFLNEIVHEQRITSPHTILNELRQRIKDSLNKGNTGESYKDGMDMAVCLINKSNYKLSYAGAYNSLYLIRNKKLTEIKADKMPVGLSDKMDVPFQLHNWQLEKGDSFYMFSDGYADQFGGPRNKKFMSKSFKKLLVSIEHHDMTNQKEILNNTINDWMGTNEQVDDILIIGIRM